MAPENPERDRHIELLDHRTIPLDDPFSERDSVTFQSKLENFLDSDPSLSEIVTVEDDSLNYLSESYTPPAMYGDKQSLFLILGNPAPESVAMQAMYAYEGNKGCSHRFWRVMDQTRVLKFSQSPDTIDPHDKMQRLYSMDYFSPFNVHIMPFYSLPTPPGGAWGGVAGIRRLFGHAFAQVEAMETERMQQYLDSYLKDGDHILVFQKDAFLALGKTQASPIEYDYRSLLKQPARSEFVSANGSIANLLCMLPTRLLHARCTKDAFEGLVRRELAR